MRDTAKLKGGKSGVAVAVGGGGKADLIEVMEIDTYRQLKLWKLLSLA